MDQKAGCFQRKIKIKILVKEEKNRKYMIGRTTQLTWDERTRK